MKSRIESVAFEGTTLRVSAREPLPAELRVLALATALRVFERFPAFSRLVLSTGTAEVSISREEIGAFTIRTEAPR